MATFAQLEKRFADLRTKFSAPNYDYARSLQEVEEIKIALLELSFLLPEESSSQNRMNEARLARELLECACLSAVRNDDVKTFERNFAQLKTYYDNSQTLGSSANEYLLLGLNLMKLLAQNRIAEFHTEFELIPVDAHSNTYINFPMQLEQYLMEGNYQKLLSVSQVPNETYKVFVDKMYTTIRGEIASCSEQAYAHLRFADAQKLLKLNSEAELLQFCYEREWTVRDRTVFLSKETDGSESGIQTQQTVHDIVTYAKELERIV